MSGGEDNCAKIWDLRRKGLIGTLTAHTKQISDVKFISSSSSFLATASHDMTVKLWSTIDWALFCSVEVPEAKLTSVSISTQQNALYLTSLNKKWYAFLSIASK